MSVLEKITKKTPYTLPPSKGRFIKIPLRTSKGWYLQSTSKRYYPHILLLEVKGRYLYILLTEEFPLT